MSVLITNEMRSDYLRHKFNAKNRFEEGFRSLEVIRDKRLYLCEYPSFEAFCQAEFGHTRQHMNRLIKADHVAEDVVSIGSIEHESWARALNSLETPLEKKSALILAYAAAPAVIPSGKPTAALIEESVATVQEMKATQGKVDLGGTMSAATASVVVKHNQRVKDAIQDTQEKRGQSNGTVVLIAKHEPCRIVAASSKRKRITFEFDDLRTFNKLLTMLEHHNNGDLNMKLTQAHKPKESA